MTRPIFDTLRDVRAGQLLEDMSTQLAQLVHAVSDTGKAGKLTLVIEVKPFERAAAAMVIKDSIKLTLPKIDSKGTVMFATPEGALQRQNPRQEDLPGITLAATKEAA